MRILTLLTLIFLSLSAQAQEQKIDVCTMRPYEPVLAKEGASVSRYWSQYLSASERKEWEEFARLEAKMLSLKTRKEVEPLSGFERFKQEFALYRGMENTESNFEELPADSLWNMPTLTSGERWTTVTEGCLDGTLELKAVTLQDFEAVKRRLAEQEEKIQNQEKIINRTQARERKEEDVPTPSPVKVETEERNQNQTEEISQGPLSATPVPAGDPRGTNRSEVSESETSSDVSKERQTILAGLADIKSDVGKIHEKVVKLEDNTQKSFSLLWFTILLGFVVLIVLAFIKILLILRVPSRVMSKLEEDRQRRIQLAEENAEERQRHMRAKESTETYGDHFNNVRARRKPEK